MANEGKTIQLTTDSEIVTGTSIANVAYGQTMDVRINGYRTEYEIVNKKHVLKAKVTPRVTYHKDGGTIDGEGNYTVYNTGEGLTLPTPHKTGYTFEGWFDNEVLTGTAVTEIGAGETGNKEYWAKWDQKEPEEYIVTFFEL